MPVARYDLAPRGLWLNGPKENAPAGSLRRARGISDRSENHIQSRHGSSAITASQNAHSIVRFASAWYYGVLGNVYSTRGGSNIITGLNGNRLTFARMPPATGVADYLCIAGGGSLKKVDSSDAVTQWGIAEPASGPSAAEGSAGVLPAGTYKIKVTFYNSTTGTESNAHTAEVSVTITDSKQIDLSSIPTSADAQVNARRLYRTFANQATLFLDSTINDNSTTTASLNTADTALGQQLRTDNTNPSDGAFQFNEVVGPHHGRLLYTRDGQNAMKSRVYYSPSGRAEAVAGFISLESGDDAIQRAVLWSLAAWIFTREHLYEMVGFTEPFQFREVPGAPGTTYPWTVTPTPYGIFYRHQDTLRVFDGTRSLPISTQALGDLLFNSASVENLTDFTDAQYGAYARDEYFLSDNTNTLSVYLAGQAPSWRDIGIPMNTAYFDNETANFAFSSGGDVLNFEVPGQLTDNGTAIPFAIEIPALNIPDPHDAIFQYLTISGDTGNQALIPTLIFDDGTTTALSSFTHNGQSTSNYPLDLNKPLVAIRIHSASGLSTARVTNIRIALRYHISQRAIEQ